MQSGWAKDRRRRVVRDAPANSIHSDDDVFQVAWACPFCIRNTTRSFERSGLSWRERPEAAAPAVDAPAVAS